MKKYRLYFYIIAFPLFFFGTICRADFDLASNYYSAGAFEKAYAEFLESAQYGDNDSQHNIGVMYYRGEHLPKDKLNAYAWMALATQSPTYKEKALHLKIYSKFSDEEKNSADEKYQALFAQYSNEVIQQKLTPRFVGKLATVKAQRIIKTVRPKYPEELLQRRASGMVDVLFTIGKDGATKDQMAYYASEKAFARAALSALRKFQYEPLLVDGKPVEVSGVKMRFNFTMDGTEYREKKITEYINTQREKASLGDGKEKLTFAYLLETIPSFAKDYKLIDNPNEWYTSAANQGSYTASYFLGRNILYGNMCTADSAQSMGWLLRAAKGGVSDAQYLLATESFSGARFEKNEEKGFYWLSKAATSNKFARVKYAWVLASHPDSKYRNGKSAQELLLSIDEDDYVDKHNLYQAQAAVAAETGNFDEAIKWQKKALEDLKELELPQIQAEARLASYTQNTPWREAI